MPVLGATLLSLLGAIVAFFSVLAALDGTLTAPWPSAPESRVGAFAAPRLSLVATASHTTLRPIPVTIAPDSVVGAPAAHRAGTDALATARKGAIVAPLVRRAPFEPTPASDEPAPPAQSKAIAKAPSPPQPRVATRSPFAPEARSALGGPRPAPPRAAPATGTKARSILERTPPTAPTNPTP